MDTPRYPQGAETHDWYPRGVPMGYGAPNPETIAIFAKHLRPGDTVVDVGGGYGRYAVPIAEETGANVTIVDIDRPHLEEADRRAATLRAGSIATVEADVLDPGVIQGEGSFNAALNAGFIYLAPPEIVREIFARMAGLVRDGGLVAVEFATDRVRLHPDGTSMMGPNEYQYSNAEGRDVVGDLFGDFDGVEIDHKIVDLTEPYRFHTKLIIAHGLKREDSDKK